MSKYIENVKRYLETRSIKQNYVALVTGWDKSKVSKVLKGTTELKQAEAEQLSEALGHDMVYFLEGTPAKFKAQVSSEHIAFFAGQLEKDDKIVADRLTEMFRFYDAIAHVDM